MKQEAYTTEELEALYYRSKVFYSFGFYNRFIEVLGEERIQKIRSMPVETLFRAKLLLLTTKFYAKTKMYIQLQSLNESLNSDYFEAANTDEELAKEISIMNIKTA